MAQVGRALRRGAAGRLAAADKRQQFLSKLEPIVEELRHAGSTVQGIAWSLTPRKIRKPRGGLIWTPTDVHTLLRAFAKRREADRIRSGQVLWLGGLQDDSLARRSEVVDNIEIPSTCRDEQEVER